MSPFNIGTREIGGSDLFFVVEEGMANLGSLSRAFSMIDAAANTGADAIEFQLLRAADFCVRHDTKYDFYTTLEFSDSEIRELVQYAKNKGLEFIAASLSDTLVEPLVRAGCSAFNINASDLTNPRLLDAVADTKLPFFMSLLLAAQEEIDWAVERVSGKKTGGFGLLHGQHTMFNRGRGVTLEETALGYLETLGRRYGRPVGFVDHTNLMWMPAAAVAAGARIVTKHLALSRSNRGPDWEICLEPNEMNQAIQWSKTMNRSMGTTAKVLAAGEQQDRSVMRKSIVSAKAMNKGQMVGQKDLAFKRPGTGVPPIEYEKFSGRILARSIPADHPLTLADFEPE